MPIILNLLLSGLAVAIASYLTPGAHVDGYLTAIIVAVVLAFLAFRLIAGVIKFGVIALIIVAALYFAGVIG